MVVLKGSRISCTITHSEKFRGAKTIERFRAEYTENGVVVHDAEFKSSSTAANFVTGTSANGLKAWKDKDGKTLQAILSSKKYKIITRIKEKVVNIFRISLKKMSNRCLRCLQ